MLVRSATHFDAERDRDRDAWIVELRAFGRSRNGVRVLGEPDLRLTGSGVGDAGEAREVVEMDRFNFGCFGVELEQHANVGRRGADVCRQQPVDLAADDRVRGAGVVVDRDASGLLRRLVFREAPRARSHHQ